MNIKLYPSLLGLLSLLIATHAAQAQFSIGGQLRTRTEFRNGQGTPQVQDTAAAVFTSQRTRINFGYKGYRFKIFAAIQDARVWGQDASSINRTTVDTNDGLLIHEAWAEISLVDTGSVIKNFSFKIGRQELVYDDVRLLGNLDWLQQARRHDAALLKFENKGWTAHVGVAYNQNAERKSNTIYNGTPMGYAAGTNGMGAMYKSMQFFYGARKLKVGNVTVLAFKDDFSKFHFADADINKTTPIYDRGVWSRYTVGANLFGNAFERMGFALSAFYQGGKYREGTSLDEYFISASALYAVNKKFSVGPGVDLTSGNNGADPAKRYRRFDPLYGTPHKFWGFMDYFYVADGFGANGLTDYYLRSKYKVKEHLNLSFDAHYFVLPAAVKDQDGFEMSKSLGTEVDFVVNYSLTKAIAFEGGCAAMFSTSTMASPKVKNVARAADVSTWAYLMIIVKPNDFTFK